MREMCDIRNINEIGKNQKCLEIGGKWHHPRIELNWTQCLFHQQWWTHSWRLSRSEGSVTSRIFEIFNISTDPPPFTHGVQSTRIWRRLLIFTRFWKFSNFFEGICRKFFIFDVKSKSAILHQVEFRNVEKNHQKMSKLSNLQGFQNWFRLVQICFFKGFWIG